MEESSRRECHRDAIRSRTPQAQWAPSNRKRGREDRFPPLQTSSCKAPPVTVGSLVPIILALKVRPAPRSSLRGAARSEKDGAAPLRRATASGLCLYTQSRGAAAGGSSVPRKKERRADAQRASRGRSGKPRQYAGRSVHVLIHRLALVLLELREHEVVLVVHEELRRALHVHEEGVHLADILHVHFLPLALDAHEVRCGNEMQRVAEGALRADLRQERLRIVRHLHVLLLGPDVDDAPGL